MIYKTPEKTPHQLSDNAPLEPLMTTRTRYARIALSLALGLMVLAGGGLQSAQAAPKRLGVVTFRGPGEGATRNVVMKVGKANKYVVVGGQQIAKAASKLHVTLETNDSFLAVARELGIAAFVTGEVSKKKATLTVRDGSDGSVAAEASWAGPNPRKLSAAVGKTFWKRLGGAIDRGKAPSGAKQAVVAEEAAAPETGADDATDEDAKSKSSSKKTASADDSSSKSSGDDDRHSKKSNASESGSETVVAAKSEPEESTGGGSAEALMVSVGPRIVNRSLAYTDNINGDVGNYALPAAPELALNADLFPAAFSQSGVLANIGLTGSVGYMLPVVTAASPAVPGKTYKTYALDWSIGAKYRLPIGAYFTAAFGDARWQLVRPAGITTDIAPMVEYRFVRLGTGGRFHVNDSVSVLANLAYLQVLSLGQIATSAYFPHTKALGVEVGAGLGYRVTPTIEIQGGVDFRQIGLNFHVSKAEYDANNAIKVAGGAADRYISGWVAVAYAMGGAGSTSHHGDDEAASSKSSDDDKAKDDDKDKDKDKDDDKGDKSKGDKDE